MLSAEMGIVWHTEYVGGPNLADTKAKFGFDSDRLGDGSNAGYGKQMLTRKDVTVVQ